MSTLKILKYFGAFVFLLCYLWFVGFAFAQISVLLAQGLIILLLLSLIIYMSKKLL